MEEIEKITDVFWNKFSSLVPNINGIGITKTPNDKTEFEGFPVITKIVGRIVAG